MSQNTLKVHDLNEDAEFDENGVEVFDEKALGNDSNLLIVFYVQIMPDDFVMQLHRF
ncbi:ISSfl2 ORF [Shigella sonnei]|nr:ISSfl2 ORF [Shigella sonnei]